MKKLMMMVLVAATLAFGQADGAKQGKASPVPGVKILTRAEIDELFTKPDQVLIVDVRRPDEIKAIGGFPVFLNVQIGDLAKSLAWIPKDRTIMTVSITAVRASRAADMLAKAGFKVAGAAGAEFYEQQGGTLDMFPAPPPNPNAKKQ